MEAARCEACGGGSAVFWQRAASRLRRHVALHPQQLVAPAPSNPPAPEEGADRRERLPEDCEPASPRDGAGTALHQLRLRETFRDEANRLRRLEFGAEPSAAGRDTKVVMVLGATGSGKTTLLNALASHALGVRWEDPFRLRLVPEPADGEGGQAFSQTSWVTAFVLHWREGFAYPFSLVAVDTPGFGDTRGVQRDREITGQIRRFLESGSALAVARSIDAIGFVTPASLPRLTPTQRFVFDSVLSLFGKDVKDNIAILATFADASPPPVASALREGGVPYRKLLKFNSSAVYSSELDGGAAPDGSDSDGEAEPPLHRLFWDMGLRSFRALGRLLETTPARTLDMTRRVLDERERLEARVQGVGRQVRHGVQMCETIRQEVDILRRHASEVEANKDFVYTVTQHRVVQHEVRRGTFVTNCLQCNFTCHDNCTFANDDKKRLCWVMDESGRCTVCPRRCSWRDHKNMPYMLVVETETVTKTSSELKAKYEAARRQKLSHSELLSALVEDFEQVQTRVLSDTNEIRLGLERLAEIALRPDALTHVDYIDTLIRSEEQAGRPGWQLRSQQLQELRKQAQHLQVISRDGYDPFCECKPGAPLDGQAREQVSGLKKNVAKFLGLE